MGRNGRYRTGCAAGHATGWLLPLGMILLMLLPGCGPGVVRQGEGTLPQQGVRSDDTAALRASLVIFIHGDGDYLYHDRRGKALRADRRILAETMRLARTLRRAEVAIFHQQSSRKFLAMVPMAESDFYYFRRGAMLHTEGYFRNDGRERFEPEITLLRKHAAGFGAGDALTAFLYFGHEIPAMGGRGYDASFSDASFTVADLASAMRIITGGPEGGGRPFDLAVLSTCYNGTPGVVQALSPYTRYLIASPENLHLSYLSLKGMLGIDAVSRDAILPFARDFTRQAFQRLTDEIQTTVALTIYDAERSAAYLARRTDATVEQSKLQARAGMSQGIEHCDCNRITAFRGIADSTGVEVYYRPPRFGRQAEITSHSGWGCWNHLSRMSTTPAPLSQEK